MEIQKSNQTSSPSYSGGFIIFFAVMTLLAWQVTRPLMMSIIWAGMLSFVVSPVYDKVLAAMHGHFPSIASMLTLCILGLLFILPLVIIFTTLGSELTAIVRKIYVFIEKIEFTHARDAKALIPAWTPKWLEDGVINFLLDSESLKSIIHNVATRTGSILTEISAKILHSATSLLFNTMVTMMVSFFFIRDGKTIVGYLKSITPLDEEECDAFFSRTKEVLNSVVLGVLLTVAVQALLGGLGWWYVGLDNPAFYGVLMFFFGMFPAGTAVVWGPGSLYLLFTGDVKHAIILFVWGATVVGTIDNVLRPFLISGGKSGEQIPTLTIILGLFGGVIAWGFIGIFLGPLVLVLFTVVLEIYRRRQLKNKQNTCGQ